MVFEEILDKIGKRKIYSLFLGILYVLISYGTANLFFPNNISLAMIFLTTLLLIPSTAKLIGIEENIERRYGTSKFLKKHYVLMEIFFFLFIGIFIGYILLGNYAPSSVEYQMNFLKSQGVNLLNTKIEAVPQLLGIFLNNISVIVVAFVLSLFYGVGALFLIVLNASVFASFVLNLLTTISQQKAFGVLFVLLHFIPEVFGFLLAAIAGGVISKAIMKEKPWTEEFRNVLKDGTLLLLLSLVIILLAALIETFVTPQILKPLL